MKSILFFVLVSFTGTTQAQNIFPVSGNVGIGTNTPDAKLHIIGQTYIEQGYINFLTTYVDGGGNTGLKANPNGWTRLDPNGSRFIMTVTNNDVTLKRNILDIENTENSWRHLMEIRADGSGFFIGDIGIGTAYPDSKLTVKGKIHTQEVKVDLNGAIAPDYVFKEDYKLKTLEETQKYIDENGHLPNIPSAKELEANGIELGVMNMKLLEKIEELTLYILQQEKQIQHHENELKRKEDNIFWLKKEISTQGKAIEEIKALLKNIKK